MRSGTERELQKRFANVGRKRNVPQNGRYNMSEKKLQIISDRKETKKDINSAKLEKCGQLDRCGTNQPKD